jgi:hypothetical protein
VKKRYAIIALCLIAMSFNALAVNLIGRMGMGYSSQFANDLPALSLKIQRSRATAVSAMLGLKSDPDDTNYALGAKIFRIIYDEPQLNFYMSGMAAYLTNNEKGNNKSGYQVDGTFGAEFFFTGLESIGFSFEYGVSLNRLSQGTTFQTTGYHLISAAVHFYL